VPPARTHDYDPAEAIAQEEDGEDGRAARTRMIAGAVVIVAAVIAAVVVYSTGMLGHDRSPNPGPVASTSAPQPAAEPAGSAKEPAAAATVPTPGPAFGLQVASFKTAGRATHVLEDLKNTTHLPGVILTTEDPDGVTWFRIVLGRFPNEDGAKRAGEDLVGRSLIAEWIVIPYTPQGP
jgi:septal ring-binding cell division protein DamX